MSRQPRLHATPGRLLSAVLALLCMAAWPVAAREYDPFVMYVFPAGGQRGTTVEGVMARGRGLEGTAQVRISGAGVAATVVAIEKPSTRLQQRSANRQDQAENPNVVKMSITIASDAKPGLRDLWLITPKGATNRFHFIVGQIPEINEDDEDVTQGQPQTLESLPILVNGQYNQGDHDVFRFPAKAGQTLVCEVLGQTIVPYIPDAVPGWFQPCLTLYDASGKEIDFVDDFRHHPDPLLIFNVPTDGQYMIEVKDALFRGREDLIYRLSIGALPYVTHIYPLGGPRGSQAQVELHGVNLPTPTVSFPLSPDAPSLRQVDVTAAGVVSNSLPFALGDLPETAEAEPNDSVEQTNKVEVPQTINGRIQQPGDADYFSFSATNGQRLVMDLRARRLDSPIDSIITLFNATGGYLGENDETIDLSEGLITHHADSYLAYTFRADGDYVLRVGDVTFQGGEEFAYRLTIAPPRLDVDLRVVPANLNLAQGSAAVVKIKAYRRDGYNEEINVAVEGLPPGYVASPAVIPPGLNETRLTITATADAPLGIISPTFIATASITDTAAQAEKKAAGEALVKTQADLATANTAYDAAEKAATDAQSAATTAQTATATATAALAAAGQDATAKRQAADQARKTLDDLTATRKAPAETALAAGATAATEAAGAKSALDQPLAQATTAAATAQQAADAAEKAAADAEVAAKAVSEDANKSEEEKKQAADLAAAKRKAADDAQAALTQAQQEQQQAQAQAAEAAQKLAEAETQKKTAEEVLAGVNGQVSAATTAQQAAEKAATDAAAAAATATAAVDKATAAQTAAEKAATDKRKPADDAKAARDKLVADQATATTRLALANEKPDVVTFDRPAIPAEELMQAFYYWQDVPTDEFLLSTIKPTKPILSTDASLTDVREVTQGTEFSVVVNVSREGLKSLLAKYEAQKKVVDDALAKTQADLAKAKTDYAAAEQAAKVAEAAVAPAKTSAANTVAAQSAAEQLAASKRKAADDAKKKLDDLIAGQQKPAEAALAAAVQAEARKKTAEQALAAVNAQVTAATTAHQTAEQAATEAQTVVANAKTAADQARAAQAAAELDAPQKRTLATQAKALQDKLVADEVTAKADVAEAVKNVEAAKKGVEGVINLKGDTPPPGVTVKAANVAADQNQATVTITVSAQAPVQRVQNVLISGSVRVDRDFITAFAPAIPVRAVAPPAK